MNVLFQRALFLAGLLLLPLASQAGQVKRLLIVGQGPDGHPPMTHEYMAGASILSELLKPFSDIQSTVVNADEPWADGPKLIDGCDGIAMFVTQGAMWMQVDEERYAALKRLAARGGAIIALHWSVGAKDAKFIPGQLSLLGATRGGEQRKYKKLETTLTRTDLQHPVLHGIDDIKVYDEFYYSLDQAPGIHPLMTAGIDGKDETAAWTLDRSDGGRSFGFVALHFHSNWQLPAYRRLVVQGVLWSLKMPVPDAGVTVDIDPKKLELNGVLPPPAGPEPEKTKKTPKVKK